VGKHTEKDAPPLLEARARKAGLEADPVARIEQVLHVEIDTRATPHPFLAGGKPQIHLLVRLPGRVVRKSARFHTRPIIIADPAVPPVRESVVNARTDGIELVMIVGRNSGRSSPSYTRRSVSPESEFPCPTDCDYTSGSKRFLPIASVQIAS